MKLLLASTNPDKLQEIRPLLAGLRVELIPLVNLPSIPEPDETAGTFWENARAKAVFYARATGLITVAEDSGLEIEALSGDPGPQSARFLGPAVPYPERFEEIYRRLASTPRAQWQARFVTALSVGDPAGELLFETQTSVDGEIAPAPSGNGGFGYDPIFVYPPFDKTTADMTSHEKAMISHRGRAVRDLRRWLRTTLGPASTST